MIPIYCIAANTSFVPQVGMAGKVYSVDDPATVNDLAAVDGTGGTPYVPFILSTLFPLRRTLGWYDFRKFHQHADAPSACTITVMPWRDGNDSGQIIARVFPVTGVDITSTPIWLPGSDFQVKVSLSAFTREVQLGNASASFVPRRHSRATGAGSNPLLTLAGFGPLDGRFILNGILPPGY